MKHKYGCYEYKVEYERIGHEKARKYVYTIYDNTIGSHGAGDFESDEWYTTREEAEKAAREAIEEFENGL